MNPFEQIQEDSPAMVQPFQETEMVYDRLFTLRNSSEGRTLDRSSITDYESLGTFRGAEPQQVQRVTTNLVSVDEGLAMQIGAFTIFTEATSLEIKKGNALVDNKTLRVYRVLSPYKQGKKYRIMVTELND